MKILIAPMEVMAETSGPMSRARRLAFELKRRGHDVSLCSAEGANYRPVEGVRNFLAPTPSPLGLPSALGQRFFSTVQRLGLQRRARVRSLEQVLFMVGALKPKHFVADVEVIRECLRELDPDVVYAEFRLSAIVAAKLEGRAVATGHSYPTRATYASNPALSRGLRRSLRSMALPRISSALEIFDWAQLKIIPSSPELEPMEGEGVVFTGPFSALTPSDSAGVGERDKIVVYMGNGTILPKEQLEVLSQAFSGSPYQVCLASAQLPRGRRGPVVVEERFDFSQLFPQAALFLNHGGQNSVMDGLVAGLPQIICPGMIFERIYNARSVEQLGAGQVLDHREFTPRKIRALAEAMIADAGYRERARAAGERLLSLGGVERAAQALEAFSGARPA